MKWAASQELEAALVAELDAKRTAIDEAEAAVEKLQERIRRESLDAGELSRRHRQASAAAERLDSAALVIRERRRSAATRAGEIELALESAKAKRPRRSRISFMLRPRLRR